MVETENSKITTEQLYGIVQEMCKIRVESLAYRPSSEPNVDSKKVTETGVVEIDIAHEHGIISAEEMQDALIKLGSQLEEGESQ